MARVKSLEEIVWKVMDDQAERKLECRKLPKERRPRKRKRPNTAIIAHAAQMKIARRLWREPELTNVPKKTRRPLRA